MFFKVLGWGYECSRNANYGLVMQVIHDCYSDFYFIKNDLFQEGVVILTHAVDLFDITKGIEFSTYAYQSVKISLRRKIKNILSKECAFSSLHTEEEVVVNTMLVDHENDVSEQSDYRDLFSNFLEKFNKLPEIVQLVTKMRLGLFEYEQMTLSEVFERVPYSSLEIFLMIKYALSYMLVEVLDYELPSQIDRGFVKNMFREFNAEHANQDPCETSEIVNIGRLNAIYLDEKLYKKIENYINRYQCRKIKLNKTGIFNLYFDGLSGRTCGLYDPVTSGLLYGDYDIDELHYTSIFNELPYGSEDIIDAVSRLNQDDLVSFFKIYKLGSNNLFRKKKLTARDLSIHSKLLSFLDNSIKERNGALNENYKKFYEYFYESQDVVEFAISFFPFKIQKLIFEFIGFNLSKYVSMDEWNKMLDKIFSCYNVDILSEVRLWIKKFIELIYSKNSLFNIFKEMFFSLSEKDINRVMSFIDAFDQDVIMSSLDDDLCLNFKEDSMPMLLQSLIKLGSALRTDQLYKYKLNYPRNIITIYDLFYEYSKEQVDSVLNILSDYDRMVLFLKYGFNLENPYQRYWDSSLSNFMKDSLIPRIQRLLEQMYKGRKRNILTLTEIFPDYSLLEIVWAASQLPNDCFLLLKKRYGDNLNAFFSKSLSTLEQNKLDHVVLPRLGRLLKTLRFDNMRSKIKTVYDYFQDKKKSIVDEAIGLLDERDKFVLFIRCGMNLSNPSLQEEYLKDATHYLSAFMSVIRKIGLRISIIENPESVNNLGPATKVKKMYLRMKNKQSA